MRVTVEIPDSAIEAVVSERVNDIFSLNWRNSNGAARQLVHKCVDESIPSLGIQAAVAEMLPRISALVMERCITEALTKATRAQLREMTRLGFDLRKLTDQERSWAEEQAAKRARV